MQSVSAKSTALPLIVISSARGVKRVERLRSSPTALAAIPTPTAPAPSASSKLSNASWRNSRAPPAPSAVRTANSRERRSCRDSESVATFATETSNRKPAVESSMYRIGRARAVISSRASAATKRMRCPSGYAAGYAA